MRGRAILHWNPDFRGYEKLYFNICLFLFFLPQDLFSQDREGSNFQVHVNYLNVRGKIREHADRDIAIGAEYHFPVVDRIGLDGFGGIGYERLLDCSPCLSEWFPDGYWAGVGLSKRFQIKDIHKFMIQARYRRVGFERNEPGLLELDGTVVRWEKASNQQDLLGLRFGYFLPIKMPLVLSYIFEDGAFHRLKSVSLGFQF